MTIFWAGPRSRAPVGIVRRQEFVSPSKLQLALATLLVAEPNISLREAMRCVGYKPSVYNHHGAETARSPGTQQALQDLLSSAGITDEIVATRLREALDYEKSRWFRDRLIGNEVDNAGRLGAVEMAAKLKGWIKNEPAQVVIVQFVQSFFGCSVMCPRRTVERWWRSSGAGWSGDKCARRRGPTIRGSGAWRVVPT